MEVNALTISTDSVAFGNVTVNSPALVPVTLTSTGLAPITVSAVTVGGTGFTMSGPTFPVTLSSGQSVTVNIQFDPTATGPATGQLTVTTIASTSDPVTIPMSGTGVAATTLSALSCSSTSFTGAGTDACTVTLTGPASSDEDVILSSSSTAVAVPAVVTVPANATTAGFTATVSSVTSTQAVTLTAAVGTTSATFAVQLNAVMPVLTINQTNLTFGNVLVNTPAMLPITLTSTGTAPVTINSATPSGSGFTVSGVTFPVTLNPTQAVTLNVLFDPAAAGSATGQLTIVSNSSVNATDNIGLSGTGAVAPGTLSTVSCNTASFTGAGTDACTVTLTGPAPGGGLSASLYSNSAAVAVPATVTVPANATTAAFTATVSPVTTAQAVTLTATVGTVSASFALQLNAATPTLGISATNVAFGSVVLNTPSIRPLILTSTGTAPVTINSATPSGPGFTVGGATFPINLNPGQAVTLSVLFDPTAAGSATGQLTIVSTSSVNGTDNIGLSGTGVVAMGTLSTLSCNTASFTGAGTDACTVTLTGPAPGAGLSVSLSSSSSAVTVPATVTVPANATTAAFTATVSAVTAAQSVTLKASAGTVSASFVLQLNAATPTLSISATSVAFGSVALNTPFTKPLILTSTGTAPVTINSVTPAGPGFTVSGATFPVTLNPTQAVTLSVRFDPTIAGEVTGELTIASNSSTNGTANISLSGTGTPPATLSSLTCSAASFTGAGTDACAVTLTGPAPTGGLIVNLSSSSAAVAVPATVSVPASETTAAFTATVSAVMPAQTVTLKASVGAVTATFALNLNAATPTLSINATTLAFGSVALNTPSTKPLILTSTGTAPVTINSATPAGPGFTVSGVTFPVTLNPSQDVTLNVQFDPTVSGAATGQLTIVSNSSTNGTANISLSGTGVSSGTVSTLSCSATSFTGAGTDACTVTLTGPAPTGGLIVNLSSSSTAVTVPTTVSVPANATTAGFTATVSPVTTAQAVTLTASVGTVSASFVLQLNAATPTLSFSATSLAFGSVALNTPSTKPLILTSTGTAPVTINSATPAGPGFTVSGATFPVTLNPTQDLTLNVQFDPTVSGAATGQLTIVSTSSTNGTANISLSGSGTPTATLSTLTCSAASFTGAGTDACTVTLTGPAQTGGLSVNLSSSSSAVTVPATVTVPANASTATFTATVSAVTTAQSVTLTASVGAVTATFALNLNAATPTLSINATSLPFGDVLLNTPATQSVILTSVGTAPVTVSAATVAGTGFSLVGATIPVTLNPTQTATLNVQFDPTVAAAETGLLTITSNSSVNGTALINLSGTGDLPAFEVNLTWDAPASSPDPVVGYNVYRALSGSSFYQLLNSAAIATTTYQDLGAVTGDVYDYYVVSVDAAGVESVPSNVVTLTIN